MTTKIRLLTPEEIAAEEKEAAEHGLTLFQYRRVKKRREAIIQKHKDAAEKRRKEKAKKKKLEQEKKQRQKEREKRKKQKAKDKEKQLKKAKSEKEKAKRLAQPKKKPVGRPKKRGPKINYYKRKKKQLALEEQKRNKKPTPLIYYKIVACRNGKQIKYIDRFLSLDDAYKKIDDLLKEHIVFPKKIEHRKTFVDVKYEYLILEHKTGENTYLRNEYGKLVEQVTNSENWGVLDKFQYDVEETFWVWGFNNNTDRKTFQWIYDNWLIGRIQSPYDIRRIGLFKNKIVFLHDDETVDIIFTKSPEEGIRFYNKLEEFIKRDKIKQVFFVGSFNELGDKRRNLEEKLMRITGWKKKKIQLSSTYDHSKK